MPIYVASSIAPRSGGTWFVLDDKYVRGSLQVVDDNTDRDAIPSMNRKEGMLVSVKSPAAVYQLDADLVTWSIFTAVPKTHQHAFEDLSNLAGMPNGLATLEASGLIPDSQLPNIAITDTFVVADEVSMLALACQLGDVAVRTDLSKSFILRVAGADQLGNWQELLSPVSGLVSISGTGPVEVSGSAQSPIISMAAATSSVPGYMTTAQALKLSNIEVGATAYVHPTGDGNLHVPATYTFNAGKVLMAGATEGAITWETPGGAGTGIGTVTDVGATSPLSSTGGATPVLSMPAASASLDGYLTSADWNTFSNKQPAGAYLTSVTSVAVTSALGFTPYNETNPAGYTSNTGTVTAVAATGPVTSSGGTTPTIAMPVATASVDGYLSASDWNLFNNKGAGAVATVSATGPVAVTGTTNPVISMPASSTAVDGYLTSTDWNTFNGKQAALGFTPYNATNPAGYTSNLGTVTSVTGTGAVSVSGTTNPVVSVVAATTSVPGTMSAADKIKLEGIATGATANVGTVTGVTATGPVASSGGTTPVISIPVATSVADGYLSAADWVAFNSKGSGAVSVVTATGPLLSSGGISPNLSLPAATSVVDGYMTLDYAAKLDGIAAGATANTGTVTNVAGTAPIVSSGGATPVLSMAAATAAVNGYMTLDYAAKLDGIAAGANAYTHPTGDGNLHVPATSTTNNGKVLTAGATAGSLSWTSAAAGTVTDVTATGPVASSGGANPVISMPAATTSVSGYLTSTDWTTFNSKQAALGFTPYNATNPAGYTSNVGTVTGVTATGPVASSGGAAPVISMAAATASVDGYLKATDFAIFASHGAGTVLSVTGTAPVVSSGGVNPAISIPAATASVNGYMTLAYAAKLDGIQAGATAYTHPTGDGNLHVPATSTTNNGKVLTAGATAGSLSWVTPSASAGTVTSVAGAGTVNGLTLTGTVTSTGSLTLGGSITSVATSGNFQMNSLGVGTAAAGTTGDIRATGDVTAYYSDQRLKDVEGNITDALRKVCSLNGVVYRGNSLAASFGYTTESNQVGLLAQEVQAVLPEVVVAAPFDIAQAEDGTEFSKSGENYLTVKYERLVPLLVEAIKAQQAQIDSLTFVLNNLAK